MKEANEFFQVFREQFSSENFAEIAKLFDYPVTISYVDPTTVHASPPEIVELMKAQSEEYRKVGVADCSVDVTTDTRIESGVHFVDVVWSYYDESDAVLFKYQASYVLREDKTGNLKAIMLAGHDVEECKKYLMMSPDGRPIGVARH